LATFRTSSLVWAIYSNYKEVKMAEEVEKKKDEDWMQKKWRPAMGWMYMIVCMLDMAIFPVMWSLAQVMLKQPITQWSPLTLQGAGLFHLAMGAVLGIAAWGRTQEKVAGAASNVSPAPATSGFGSSPSTFSPAPSVSAPAGSFGSTPAVSDAGFGGGFAPDPAPMDAPAAPSRPKPMPKL
jgi:Holin of 3TMs, for gene-transfer release